MDKGGEGVEQVQTFCGQGGRNRLVFRYFVRASFMDGPLVLLIVYSLFQRKNNFV